MLYRVLIPLLLAAFALTSCDEKDGGDGFHQDPERGYITIQGPSILESLSCQGELLSADYFGIFVRDSVGHPMPDVVVSVTTDGYLFLIEPADSVIYTNDSGYVELLIGTHSFGYGFLFQVTAAGDTEVFHIETYGDDGIPNGSMRADNDTLFTHPGAPDSMKINATFKDKFGASMSGGKIWFSASAGRIDTTAQAYEQHDIEIYWYPPEPAQLDDVFVYARFGYWCHFLRDSIFDDAAVRDTTSFIVFPTS